MLNKRFLVIFLICIITGALLFMLLYSLGFLKINNLDKKDAGFIDSRRALDLAFDEANKWKPDAQLSFIEANEIGSETNGLKTWRAIFVSDQAKGKGLQIKVTDSKVVDILEIDYSGKGAELPPSMMSQSEAIERVRNMPGYESAEILGVEAVYGPAGKIWYWGVKTSKGIVSIEAK